LGGSRGTFGNLVKSRSDLFLPLLVVEDFRNLIPGTRSQLWEQEKGGHKQDCHERQKDKELHPGSEHSENEARD
jgi:hypothetical protein